MQSVDGVIVSHALMIATLSFVVLWADRWLRRIKIGIDVRKQLADEVDELEAQRDHLARLVDSGDLDGAREVAREILEGGEG